MSKLWAAQRDKLPITLMSSLRLYSLHWQWCDSQEEADLWCINAETDNIKELEKFYWRCSEKKPKVIYFSEQFVPMPVSDWVFFKTPLNIRVFHRWLLANSFVSTVYDNKSDSEKNADKKWKTHRFKLTFWPNITQYAEGADIMMVCSMMMHDWCDYNQLIPFNIDEEILTHLLNDAEEEGNLRYEQKKLIPDNSSKAPSVKEDNENLGLFKKIFSRFRR